MGGQIPDADKAYMISLGEYLSSNIVCFMMNALGLKTAWLDARHFMITSHDYLTAAADVPEVQKRAKSVIERAFKNADAVITQGFMGVTIEGDPTIMGRGSSDYSASLLGMVLDADRIEIWTDVDGICTADPNIVPEARGISKLSYEEAAELARFGAKVLHPLSIEPAASKNIPLYVLNSMNPDCEGTVVMNRSCIFDGVKSISYNENIRMINIYSPKMINTSGFMSKIFGIFERQGVSVDMISTAEASVTVTVDASVNTDPLAAALSKLGNVTVDRDKSQVSIIGKNLIGVKGAVAAVFEAVSDSKIYMMSQGSSFLNLSIVVDRPEMTAVIRKLHKSFFENGN
jgi:aspartate kinase